MSASKNDHYSGTALPQAWPRQFVVPSSNDTKVGRYIRDFDRGHGVTNSIQGSCFSEGKARVRPRNYDFHFGDQWTNIFG